MKTTPILYNTPMVQAIKENRKTNTRRTNKLEFFNKATHKYRYDGIDQSGDPGTENQHFFEILDYEGNPTEKYRNVICPFGAVGDILWVRETFVKYPVQGKKVQEFEFEYKADESPLNYRWIPSIHMPKEACRLFLKITGIRIERLQDISEQDAIAEGVLKDVQLPVENFQTKMLYRDYTGATSGCADARSSFMTLWISVYGKESWNENPWVWAIEFEKIEKPENF